jgi:hypothetical protein
MFKTGADDWKTPLGYYERAIAELRKTREEIQSELQNLKLIQPSLLELPKLKADLQNSQLEIQTLKAELAATQKVANEAQSRVDNAEREANATQKELQHLKENMIDNSNPQVVEFLANLKEQLSHIPTTTSTTDGDEFKTQVIQSLANLQTQVSKLSDELMLVSTATGTDYSELRNLLTAGEWRKADEKTKFIMCKISNRDKEGWLDRGEIERFPWQDIRIINRLWVECSNGRFGFSVQKQLWQSINVESNNDFEVEKTLSDRIGWRVNNNWIKYDDFTFDINAAEGHLPCTLHLLKIDAGRVENRMRLLFSRRELQF